MRNSRSLKRRRASLSALVGVLVPLFAVGCSSSPTSPGNAATFVIDVSGERFSIRTADPETIRLADENRLGGNGRIPTGTLKPGDGGFNAPWTWHLDPASVRFVDAAIEICDGRPSYVESHQSEYPSYCPWGARVVARR